VVPRRLDGQSGQGVGHFAGASHLSKPRTRLIDGARYEMGIEQIIERGIDRALGSVCYNQASRHIYEVPIRGLEGIEGWFRLLASVSCVVVPSKWILWTFAGVLGTDMG